MGLEPDPWGGRMNHRDRVSVRALIVVAGMMLVPIVVNASPAAAATIPPVFESATHADTLLNELSSLNISVPATTQNGDVLVLFIESANVEDPGGLSGWTKVDSGDAGSSLRGSSYYHVASSEPASYTLTYPDIQHISAFMLDYRGVDTSDPISAHGVVSNDIDSLTIASPTLSGVGASDAVLIGFHARGVPVGIFTLIPPSGWTERAQQVTNSPNNPDIGASIVEKVGGTDSPSETASILVTSVATSLALRGVTVNPTGGLTVTKAAPAGSTVAFDFTVTCSGDPNSPYTFHITGSGSHPISGIPAGTSCTVAEASPGTNYNAATYSPSASVVVPANDTVTVTVTNTLKTGDLQITKVAPAGSTQTYDFNVECTSPDTSPVGPYTASVNGSASTTITGIPAGSSCTVAETDPGSTYNPPGYSPSATVTIQPGATATVTVTNSLRPGTLTITKVAPAQGQNDTFRFAVGCGSHSYTLTVTGSGSATQSGIPAGSVCTITESVPAGYATPSYSPSNHVTVGAGQEVAVTVTNRLLPIGISIAKTVSPTSGTPGTALTYTYIVKNSGKVDLLNVQVNDDKLGHVGSISVLKVGQSATLKKSATLGSASVRNVGTAVGHDRFGREATATDSASATVVLAVGPLGLPRTGSDPRLPFDGGFGFLGLGFVLVAIAGRRRSASLAIPGRRRSASGQLGPDPHARAGRPVSRAWAIITRRRRRFGRDPDSGPT